jgi:TRAP-type C4-dicarboxylate transport system permease small subunit
MEKGFLGLLKFFDYLARLSVLAMMGITVGDILLRKPLRPIPGTYDFVSFLCAAAVAFAIPYSTALKGHIQVELFVSRLPGRIQALIEVLTGLFSLFFFALVSWQSFCFAADIKRAGEVSMSAHLPFYPFIFLISVMCGFVCIVLLIEIGRAIAKTVKA